MERWNKIVIYLLKAKMFKSIDPWMSLMDCGKSFMVELLSGGRWSSKTWKSSNDLLHMKPPDFTLGLVTPALAAMAPPAARSDWPATVSKTY